jgi:drug/metabolite transporter (DMT)-like permease
MSWIFLAFGSITFFTSLNLLQRVLAVESKNPRAMAVLFNVVAALIAILIFILTGAYRNFSLPYGTKPWMALLIASLGYAIFERGRFVAAKLLDASIFTTVGNISVLVAFTGALFLYGESLTTTKLIGGSLVLLALLLVSINGSIKKASLKGLAVGIFISIMLGIGWMLDKLGAQYFNSDTYNILIWTLPVIFIYFPYMKIDDIKTELKLASWKVFLLAGLNVVGYLMQLKALEIAEATRVIPIIQTSTLTTVLFGIILLKERERITIKIVAGSLALLGTYFLI